MILPRSGIRAKPGIGGSNRLVLFALATLLAVNLSFACDDERTEAIDAAQEDSEGSRALGGIPAKPFPWLMNIWAAGPIERGSAGKFAGFGMRITNSTFLASDASCKASARFDLNIHMKDLFELKVPEKINVSAGPAHNRAPILACSHLHDVGIRTGFSLYHLNDGTRQKVEKLIFEYDIKEGVPFQNDPKVEKDCYFYGYSSNLDDKKKLLEIKTFRKSPVNLMSCGASDNGYCKFEFHRVANKTVGHSCPKLSDAGGPIICGGKVSFVVDYQKDDKCKPFFYGLKLALHSKDLKAPPGFRYHNFGDN